jgi:mechanosensitive ion channel-like protein
MWETMQQVLKGVLARLEGQMTTYLPPLFAALITMLGAYLSAVLVRWVLNRIFKGIAVDRFLRRSGLAFMLDPSGRLRATRLVSEAAYWLILLTGFLIGLSVFNTDLTTQMTQSFVLLLPKLVVAALILLAGAWLAQYLGRSTLVWAVNESLPSPRKLSGAVRIVIMFVAVVVAAEQLDFARNVFLAAFIILLGGAALAASLALGLGGRDAAKRYFQERAESGEDEAKRSLWSHL